MNLNEVKSDWISELGSPLVVAGYVARKASHKCWKQLEELKRATPMFLYFVQESGNLVQNQMVLKE